ncbi:MAG: hypothetical protein QOJ03_44 [Frankiaceae bacterium]|jgi:hypothetical protein|nr:hypothetical protein [Frankiaceae bacterium]
MTYKFALAAIATTAGSLIAGGIAASPAGAAAGAHGFWRATTATNTQITSSKQPATLVRDPKGREHVVTTVADSTTTSHIVYITHRPGGDWIHNRVGAERPDGIIDVEEHLNPAGSRVFALFYQCNGIFLSAASTRRADLPHPQLVARGSGDCDDDSRYRNYAVQYAVPLGRTRIGVLVRSITQASDTTALWTGRYGSTFHPGPPIPSGHDFYPIKVARDVATGRVYVVGVGNSYNSDGSVKSRNVYVTAREPGEKTWTPLRKIAGLGDPQHGFYVEALTAYRNHVYVGLERPVVLLDNTGHRLYYVAGRGSTDWRAPRPVGHTNSLDTQLQLTVNPDTRRLHAAWSRWDKTAVSGVRHSSLGSSGWAPPRWFSHRYGTFVTDIAFKHNGHVVLGYMDEN